MSDYRASQPNICSWNPGTLQPWATAVTSVVTRGTVCPQGTHPLLGFSTSPGAGSAKAWGKAVLQPPWAQLHTENAVNSFAVRAVSCHPVPQGREPQDTTKPTGLWARAAQHGAQQSGPVLTLGATTVQALQKDAVWAHLLGQHVRAQG